MDCGVVDYNYKVWNLCQDVDHCQDEDHCQYHLGIDPVRLETAIGIESTVRMEISNQMIKTSGLPEYN